MAVPVPRRHDREMNRSGGVACLLVVASALLAGCASEATEQPPVELVLTMLNSSGVEGSVRLVAVGPERTRVEIEVDPAGHASMPAHIHPGSCAELVPQPKYALENVVDGRSTTEVPVSLEELVAGDQAVNLHRSNQEMDVYAACVDLS
jgi:hypothetical protein